MLDNSCSLEAIPEPAGHASLARWAHARMSPGWYLRKEMAGSSSCLGLVCPRSDITGAKDELVHQCGRGMGTSCSVPWPSSLGVFLRYSLEPVRDVPVKSDRVVVLQDPIGLLLR